ncbi:MAG: sugar phosphate isomerase/epimerase family protein [Acidobacteriota bacterium]
MEPSRRGFLAAGTAAIMGSLGIRMSGSAIASPPTPERRFYMDLSCGRIGVKATFPEAVDLAVRHGFEAVDPDVGYFSHLSASQIKDILSDLKAKGLRFGPAGLPVNFRKDDTSFQEGLKQLPSFCKTLQQAGVWRVSTYILSFHPELTYLQNFRTHAYRLRACAQILKDHGQKLGLEYVGPMTSWRSQRHPFIHTLSETKELIVAIGTGNVGIQLDSWHWFTAEEGEADLLTLRNEDVITVDLNDAPASLPLDKQMDLSRELPAATGVIPVKMFLDALRKIGYDGPVHAEPFNAALRAMPREEACAATAAAMKKAFSL